MTTTNGGVKNAVQRISTVPGARLQLSTCSGGPTPVPVPTDPYLARLHAKLHATPRDLAGFHADIRADARGHAGNATTRVGFEQFVTDGVLSWAESMRAVALQELGPEAGWPEPVNQGGRPGLPRRHLGVGDDAPGRQFG